jgi:hypothetical protein
LLNARGKSFTLHCTQTKLFRPPASRSECEIARGVTALSLTEIFEQVIKPVGHFSLLEPNSPKAFLVRIPFRENYCTTETIP